MTESPTLEETLRLLDTTLRTSDGTILPSTFIPGRSADRLIEALPQLERNDAAKDLSLGATIGEGGMGRVRAAEQLAIGRQVAVKTLRTDKDDPALALLILREAWVTGALEHPNIIPIYSVGVDAAGRPMIVMKKIDGDPWSSLIRDPSYDLRWHLKILAQVTNAVEFAASRGIVHRDLKPSNVMIGSFGEVYVVDWGIAVSLGDSHGGRFALAKDVDSVAGTPAYMAPEMVRADGDELSVRTDVYLLGAILHELITKRPRHEGGDVGSMLLAAMASEPCDYAKDIPPELGAIANRATDRDPARRFASARELREAVERFLEHESSQELVDQAEQRLTSWGEIEEPGTPVDPVAVQTLFGEARFALEQALREWPENQRAIEALRRCLERKFEYDLSRDDFESAAVVLASLGAHRLELKARLDQLAHQMSRRKAELVELRNLQKSRNLDTGRRTRAFLMMVTAVTFGGVPVAAAIMMQSGIQISFAYFYVTSGIKLLSAALLVAWARQTLAGTEVNRQLTASIFLLIIMELAIRPFAQRLGHPIEHSLFVDFGMYFLVTATLAITVDRRLAWSTLAYLIGAALSSVSIDLIYWFLGAAHLISGMVAAVVWRPKYLFVRNERAALARRV